MLIDAPEEWKMPTSSTPSSTPSSTSQGLVFTDNENIKRIIYVLGNGQMSVKEMLLAVGLKDRMNFKEYTLTPAVSEGFVRMLYPDSPRHPRQKYLLTVKGLALFNDQKS